MTTTRAEILQSLKLQLQQISKGKSQPADFPGGSFATEISTGLVSTGVVSTGVAALDLLLPQRGVPKGGMVEWLTTGAGAGAATLAMAGVCQACEKRSAGTVQEMKGGRFTSESPQASRRGYWVVIDPQRQFFPPAAWGWGVLPEQLLIVQPASERDAAWAFEQALRCPGVAVTWIWTGSVTERMLQRWKIAAEVGGGQGVLFRSDRALKQAAWADIRWLVQPVANHEPGGAGGSGGRRFRLKLVYCRGALGGEQVEVECDDETGVVRVVPQLADSASRVSAARA
jgi:protein ImuA